MTLFRHGRKGGDARGNCFARRARKLWMLSPAAGFGGDGRRVPCRWCGAALDYATVEADRWPVPGRDGGAYVRGNIVPACRRCNARATPRRAIKEAA